MHIICTHKTQNALLVSSGYRYILNLKVVKVFRLEREIYELMNLPLNDTCSEDVCNTVPDRPDGFDVIVIGLQVSPKKKFKNFMGRFAFKCFIYTQV